MENLHTPQPSLIVSNTPVFDYFSGKYRTISDSIIDGDCEIWFHDSRVGNRKGVFTVPRGYEIFTGGKITSNVPLVVVETTSSMPSKVCKTSHDACFCQVYPIDSTIPFSGTPPDLQSSGLKPINHPLTHYSTPSNRDPSKWRIFFASTGLSFSYVYTPSTGVEHSEEEYDFYFYHMMAAQPYSGYAYNRLSIDFQQYSSIPPPSKRVSWALMVTQDTPFFAIWNLKPRIHNQTDGNVTLYFTQNWVGYCRQSKYRH